MDDKLVALHNGKPQKVKVVQNGTIQSKEFEIKTKTIGDFQAEDDEPIVECEFVKAAPEEKEIVVFDWLGFMQLYAIFGSIGFIAGVMTTLAVLNHIGAINIGKLVGF